MLCSGGDKGDRFSCICCFRTFHQQCVLDLCKASDPVGVNEELPNVYVCNVCCLTCASEVLAMKASSFSEANLVTLRVLNSHVCIRPSVKPQVQLFTKLVVEQS